MQTTVHGTQCLLSNDQTIRSINQSIKKSSINVRIYVYHEFHETCHLVTFYLTKKLFLFMYIYISRKCISPCTIRVVLMGVIWWGTGGDMSPPLFYPPGMKEIQYHFLLLLLLTKQRRYLQSSTATQKKKNLHIKKNFFFFLCSGRTL